MAEHMWIEGVLKDILEYARKNGLTVTQIAVSDAISALSEDTGSTPGAHVIDFQFGALRRHH